ncbi:tRNA uridine-5-carboxymethylaminomethyl(34) synthesis GTPase MnmE [Anaerosphaera multitolerans]|uniref:tRNA modification GTPase MnmE n=1 Tax=Anaerosphaera multitolerans TaxID=2487351 RepID=A0A437SAB6_9FIRM|nr:tRNA uridine-5-carboxymethylaminomethyl(34) synthesis GTPase MnmE [Anaerosphaera multitolerans]RVU55748.1 tRNA uridine-5-carboxymethylaminomethyl(34) synthesis GTPase MnmE [Anaerosphaera multitolerans]
MINNETISAISTATGEAGIGIVRMSGDRAIEIANNIFKPIGKKSLDISENRKLLYGHIYDGSKLVDEVLIVKMEAPHTYTREDVVEIYCHGGIISVRKILNLTLDRGAVIAEPGEFTKRAFLNGRLDLTQAEAVIDLIKSKSEISYDVSIRQLEGSLSGKIEEIRERVMAMTALIVANIDFPEDEIVEATYKSLDEDANYIMDNLNELIENANRGKLLRDGINTVILGKPNVGKSSLLNGLLRDERAIVTDIPGTTRDVITDYVNLDGILLKITDTAGIRDTEDKVEKIGVDLAKKSIEDSDLIIAIFDSSRPFDDDDREIIKLIESKKSIVLMNKADLKRAVSEEDIKDLLGDRNYLNISVVSQGEILKIEDEIKELFFGGEIKESSDIYVNNLRHVRALKKARDSMYEVKKDIKNEMFLDLLEVNLEDVLSSLGEITGQTTTEDVLDKVFSEFCIGK